MILTFLTCPRTPAYIHQTLVSLLLSHPYARDIAIRLQLDADDTSYLSAYENLEDISVRPLHEGYRKRALAGDRVVCGLMQAIHEAMDAEHFVVAEDDVVFAKSWIGDLRSAVIEAERRSGTCFVLSGYCPTRMVSEKGIARWNDPATFFGNQFLYLPAGVRAPLVDFLRVHLGEGPGDILLGKFAKETGVPIYSMVPSIVQHVGRQSTLNSPFHTAPDCSVGGMPCAMCGGAGVVKDADHRSHRCRGCRGSGKERCP